jgi:CheY-like chemotaxis protein
MAKKRILFVEDNRDNALLISEELELGKLGGEVVIIKDGQEAMDYFNKADEVRCSMIMSQVGLVLLDLDLPKIDGWRVLKFLKKTPKYRSIPVIILTTSSDQKAIDQAFRNGANGFQSKDIFFEDRYLKKLERFKELLKFTLTHDSIDKIK